MSLRTKILVDDFKSAMKEKDLVIKPLVKSVNTEIRGAIKNREIETKTELTDIEITDIIKKIIKETNESVEGFTSGGNHSEAQFNKLKLPYMEAYLPKKISASKLQQLVDIALEGRENLTMKDMGSTIKMVKLVLDDTNKNYDGKELANIVKASLC